ncbi:MAG: right-handed parallel beta-helix repeat-containing protein [Phycisphaerales bacterium]|nr:right-handed parallel beta-helix repeat-containing protein [Phycisphaerales bacterium]
MRLKVWPGVMAGVLVGVATSARSDDPLTFAAQHSPICFVHVSPRGDDDTADGSEDRPYATLAAAARKALPGTAIRLAPGDHPGGATLANLAGTPDAPIWIGSDPEEARAIIRGGGSGLHLIRPRFVVIHDLEITGADGNGLNVDDGGDYDSAQAAHHVAFERLFIHDIGRDGNQDGLKLSGLRDFQVVDCVIDRCGGAHSGSGIDMVGCHAGLIARCTLRDISGTGVQCKGGTSDIDIRWCRFNNAGLRALNIGGSTGLDYFRPPLDPRAVNWEARNVRAQRNVIEGSQSAIAFVGASECVASGNTIIRPEKWVLRILQETRTGPGFEFGLCGDNRFEHNLVWFERRAVRSGAEVNVGPGTRAESTAFSGNLWFAGDDPTRSAPSLPSREQGAVIGLDPLLSHPDAGDFRPRAGSPALSASTRPVGVGPIGRESEAADATIGAFAAVDE